MIYLLGGSGYVGQAYQRLFKARGIAYRSISRAEINYTHYGTLLSWLNADKPQFLINCAGYTGNPNVEAAEHEKDTCLIANAVLPARIARACTAAGVPWGHVSSGCIYTGTRTDWQPFTESDPPNFCFGAPRTSFYSGTKALGEQMLAGSPELYIWRMRIPFNEVDHPRNFLTKIMAYEKLLDVVDSLSQLDEFCAATLDCWQRRVPFGTYNVTNPGWITKREVMEILDEYGVHKGPVNYWKDEAEYMRLAGKTPRSACRLNTGKLAAVGVKMTEVHEAVANAARNWRKASE